MRLIRHVYYGVFKTDHWNNTSSSLSFILRNILVAVLGCVIVIIITTGPRGSRVQTRPRTIEFYWRLKSVGRFPLEGEVIQPFHVARFDGMLENPTVTKRYLLAKFTNISRQCSSCLAIRYLGWLLPESSGG
jgi:hypothetical protein